MKILVAGATSAIAQATMRQAAQHGDELFLVARNEAKLAAVRDDLRVRGGQVAGVAVADLDDLARHEALVEEAREALGGLDVLLVAHGVLTDQQTAQNEPDVLARDIKTNFVGVAALSEAAARVFEKQGGGVIAVISSVAGDRGRQSNYAYGAAKAGLIAYLSGLRNRLARNNVAVVDVRVGMVDTPMTAHLAKGPLFAQPDGVGRDIYRAIEKRKDVVYAPFFWRPVMFVIRSIPERVFKRLSL